MTSVFKSISLLSPMLQNQLRGACAAAMLCWTLSYQNTNSVNCKLCIVDNLDQMKDLKPLDFEFSQPLPVEADAMARLIGRGHDAVLEKRRILYEALQPKAVYFEI